MKACLHKESNSVSEHHCAGGVRDCPPCIREHIQPSFGPHPSHARSGICISSGLKCCTEDVDYFETLLSTESCAIEAVWESRQPTSSLKDPFQPPLNTWSLPSPSWVRKYSASDCFGFAVRVDFCHFRHFLVGSQGEGPMITIVSIWCFTDCRDVLKQFTDCSTENRIDKPACFSHYL